MHLSGELLTVSFCYRLPYSVSQFARAARAVVMMGARPASEVVYFDVPIADALEGGDAVVVPWSTDLEGAIPPDRPCELLLDGPAHLGALKLEVWSYYEDSYGILLHSSYEKLVDEDAGAHLPNLVELGMAICAATEPLYGMVGHEESAPDLSELAAGEPLPSNWAFLGPGQQTDRLDACLHTAQVHRPILGGGVFWSLCPWAESPGPELAPIETELLKTRAHILAR